MLLVIRGRVAAPRNDEEGETTVEASSNRLSARALAGPDAAIRRRDMGVKTGEVRPDIAPDFVPPSPLAVPGRTRNRARAEAVGRARRAAAGPRPGIMSGVGEAGAAQLTGE